MPGSSELLRTYSHSCQDKADKLLQAIQNEFRTGHRQILIPDPDHTKRKLESLISGGRQNFRVISDFDHTISKYHCDSQKAPTCHGIFELDPEVTSEAKSALKMFRETYYPISMDPKLSNESKIPLMIQWWQKSHDIIVKCGITRSGLDKTVRDCGLVSRDNVDQFLELSSSHNIPVLIFSAGLGDVIQLYLKHSGFLYDNIRVVSNFMIFNDRDELIDFSKPIIHSFNKNVTSLDSDEHVSEHTNVLLIGDNPGDIHMADGLIKTEHEKDGSILRIGFLNDAIEESMDRFKSSFDIVLVNDDTFDIPLKILQSVVE